MISVFFSAQSNTTRCSPVNTICWQIFPMQTVIEELATAVGQTRQLPTKHSTIEEPQNSTVDISKQHRICPYTDFEALKLIKKTGQVHQEAD